VLNIVFGSALQYLMLLNFEQLTLPPS